MLEPSRLNRGNIVASSALAVGVTGTVVDPNGPVGITLFGLAVAATGYLVARPLRKIVHRRAAAPRLEPASRRTVAWTARPRTMATVVAAMGVLFTLWLTIDMTRPLVYACWWGGCLLAAWLVAVIARTAHRSLRTAG